MRRSSRKPVSLDGFKLSEAERRKLVLFVTGQRAWAVRHALPLQDVLAWNLRRHWLELLGVEQAVPHPIYELRLRLGRSSPSTKEGVGVAVRQAFAEAGRRIGRKFVHVVLRGQYAKVTVYIGTP